MEEVVLDSNPKSKKKLFVILSIIIIVIIVIAIVFLFFRNDLTKSKEYRQCNKEADTKAIDLTYGVVTSSSHSQYITACLMRVVIESKDITKCKQTSNPALCEGRIMKDSSSCQKKYPTESNEDKAYKFYCLEGVAIETNNIEPCLLVDPIFSARCISEIAIKTLDYQKCLEIQKLSLENPNGTADSCLISLMYDGHYDSQICYHISNLNSSDQCFEHVGKKLNDSNLCEKIVQNKFNSKWDCLHQVGKSLSSVEICKMIPEEGEAKAYSSLCYRDVAITKKDVNICYLMENSSENEIPFCITNVATETKNKETCNQITDTRWPNKTICALYGDLGQTCLDGKTMRERCIAQIQ